MILNDNKFFKLLNHNFYLTFGCKLIVPIVNKKIFKDKFGQNQEVKLFLVEFDEHVASLWPKS